MAKTDRQTDKGTWWSVTAYNDEITVLQDNTKWPADVKTIYGGLEECPTTGKVHFQGAIQLNKQQRLKWFKSWLPTAHLEVAIKKDALMKYAMKDDTAIGEKLVVSNATPFYTADQICVELAKSIYLEWDELEEKSRRVSKPDQFLFDCAINRMLMKDRKLAGQLMNPSLRKFWINTITVWRHHAKLELGQLAAA